MDLTVPLPWPVELGSKLTGVHGGAVARLNIARPALAERWRGEWLGSYTTFVRCLCARKEGARWRRSYGRDGVVDGELWWSGEPIPARELVAELTARVGAAAAAAGEMER